MKRLLAFVVVATLGVATIGCDSGKTETKKVDSTTTSGPNGTAETKKTTDTTTKTDDKGGSTTETTTTDKTKTPGTDTSK